MADDTSNDFSTGTKVVMTLGVLAFFAFAYAASNEAAKESSAALADARRRYVRANPSEPPMNVRQRMREQQKAKEFIERLAKNHGNSAVGDLGDQLVSGEFDWRDWFNSKPSSVFMNALDAARIEWEETH